MKFVLPFPSKMHNEVHNVLNSKIYWKTEFHLSFGLAKKTKNKFTSSIEYSSYK